jgi:ribonuclease R
VPVSTLGSDYFRYDEASQTLTGDDTNVSFAPGQFIKLKLAEANPVSGGLRFELEGTPPGRSDRGVRRDRKDRVQGKRGRPGNIRHKGGRR